MIPVAADLQTNAIECRDFKSLYSLLRIANPQQPINNKTMKKIIEYTIVIALSCFLAYLYIGAFFKKKSLHDNAENAIAVVIDSSQTVGTVNYFWYKFEVNNIEYLGSWKNSIKNPFLAGDTILIVYDTTNPENNTPGWRF